MNFLKRTLTVFVVAAASLAAGLAVGLNTTTAEAGFPSCDSIDERGQSGINHVFVDMASGSVEFEEASGEHGETKGQPELENRWKELDSQSWGFA